MKGPCRRMQELAGDRADRMKFIKVRDFFTGEATMSCKTLHGNGRDWDPQ